MANSNMKKANVASDVLKRTASLVGGAVTNYFRGAMPTTTSTISEAAKTASKVSSTFSSKSGNIVNTIRSINAQGGLKKIYAWYMDEANQFSTDFDFDSSLSFDIDIDEDNEIEIAQISETAASTNQISESMIMSSHKLLEGQVEITGNIINKIESQSSILSAGFDSINSKLNDLIEVVTKNSAVLIETTAAASDRFDKKETSAAESMITGGFDPAKLAKLISENMESDLTMGMVKAFAPMLLDRNIVSMMMTPDEVVKMIAKPIIDKVVPGLNESLKTIDDTINETVMTTLISLGANKSWGFGDGSLIDIASKLLGIDASRKEVSGSKAKLDVKAATFDTLTREAIINVIPGYLSKILEKLDGNKQVYDYKSRSFKDQGQIRNEFMDATTTRGSIYSASKNVSNAIGTDDFGSMVYDLMMTDLGSKFRGGQSKKIASSFADPSKFVEYVSKDLFNANGVSLGNNEILRLEEMGRNIAAKDKEAIANDIFMQSAKTNVQRSAQSKQYVNEASKYETDLTGLRTSASDEMKHILSMNGRLNEESESVKAGAVPATRLSGVSYTNKALYEIFRVLNRGLNVFRVGKSDVLNEPFRERGDDFLPKPDDHRPKSSTDKKVATLGAPTQGLNVPSNEEEANLLRNNETEDGEMEDLKPGERLGRWAKERGSGLKRAILSGDQDAVREEFGIILRDVTQVTGDAVKKGAKHINDQFGNVSGYLKHKFFGTGYSYTELDENGKEVTRVVADNEKGGVFGFVKDKMKDMFSGTKEKAQKWFQSVASYFDYGDSKSEKNDVINKRKQLISASVGAMIGGGILGGPIGLIMGAVAGNAIGGVSGIGDKIKEVFLGHDEKTGKGTGIITRLADAVILPIKYQFGKTMEHIASNLKKNILGPLSDIGQAIKDRITTAAESTIGKAFKKIADLILAPFKGIGKALLGLVKLPVTIIGGLTRTASSLGTNLVGAGLSSVANTIARSQEHTYIDDEGNEQTISSRKNLSNRRKARKQEAKEDKNNSKYKSFKEYRKNAWNQRLENDKKLAEYTSERILTPEEIQAMEEEREARIKAEEAAKKAEDQNDQIIEIQSEMNANISDTSEAMLTAGSIYTHDKGLHERLDTIINLLHNNPFYSGADIEAVSTKESPEDHSNESSASLQGESAPTEAIIKKVESSGTDNKPEDDVEGGSGVSNKIESLTEKIGDLGEKIGNLNEDNSDVTFSSSGLSAAASISTISGVDNSTDQRLFGQVISESIKDEPNKSVIGTKIRELFNNQKDKNKDEEEDENGGFLSTLLGGIGSIISNIGESGWFKNLLTSLGALATIAGALNAIKNWLNPDESETVYQEDDPVTTGANSATQYADVTADSVFDYANPFAPLYRVDKDGSGEAIVNQTATEAKFNNLLGIDLKKLWYKDFTNRGNLKDEENKLADLYDSDDYKNLKANLDSADSEVSDIDAKRTETRSKAQEMEHGEEKYKDTDAELSDRFKHQKDRMNAKADDLDAEYDEAVKRRTSAQTDLDDFEANSGINDSKQKIAEANDAIDTAHSTHTSNAVNNIGRNVARGLVLTGASNLAGGVATSVSQRLGLSEETSETVGDIATTATAGALSSNTIVSAVTGKKSMIDKVIDGFNYLLQTIAKVCKADDMLKKFGNKIDNIVSKLSKGLVGKIDDLILTRLDDALIKAGVKGGLGTASLGIGLAVGALIGIADGLCGVEYLFQVKPGEADATMTIISTVIKTITSTISYSPFSWVIALIEVLDSVAMGVFDCGIYQFVAQELYKLIKGDAALENKQSSFKMELVDYNEKYGTDLGTNDFNDLVNNKGFFDWAWRGKNKTNEDGSLKFDKAGGRIDGGIKGFFVGGEKDYLTDEEGNVIRDDSGKAVEKKDKYGRTKKVDEKWGDKVGNFFSDIGGFFGGRDIYKTDEEGNAMVDEDGQYIVEGHEKNIFGKISDGVGSIFGGVKDKMSSIGDKIGTTISQTVDTAKSLGDKMISGDLSGFISESGSIGADEEGGVGAIGKILTTMMKVPMAVPTAVSALAHKIGDGISAIINKVKDFGSMISEEYKYGQELLYSKEETHLADYFNIEDDPENPLNGISKVIRVGARLVAIPVGLIKAVGSKIGNAIGKVVDKIKNSISTIKTNAETLSQKASSGDVNGLWSTTLNEDPENPVGGITNAIFTITKIMYTPSAALHWVGGKIKAIFETVKTAVATGFSNLQTNHTSISSYANSGDPGGLLNLAYQDDPNNPLGGITKVIFTIDKFLHVR